jgi:hypothetical protein
MLSDARRVDRHDFRNRRGTVYLHSVLISSLSLPKVDRLNRYSVVDGVLRDCGLPSGDFSWRFAGSAPAVFVFEPN